MAASDLTDSVSSRRQRRRMETRRSVRILDQLARWTITIGGIGTILAVFLVAVFLVWVAVPLFESEKLVPTASVTTGDDRDGPSALAHLAAGEYGEVLWTCDTRGQIEARSLADGKRLNAEHPFRNKIPTASAFAAHDGGVVFGFTDGSLQLGNISFATAFLEETDVPAALRQMRPGESRAYADGMLQRTGEGQLRKRSLRVTFQDPIELKNAAAIHLVDVTHGESGHVIAALDDAGMLHLGKLSQRKNLLTGKTTIRAKQGTIQVPQYGDVAPGFLLLSGLGDAVYLAWPDGHLVRFDTRNVTQPFVAETVDLVEEAEIRLTRLTFLTGKTSLVAGDSAGRITVWFRTKPENADTPDGAVLVAAHRFHPENSPVAALASSARSRMLAASFANGHVCLMHVTSDQPLATATLAEEQSANGLLTIAPKDDYLIFGNTAGFQRWQISAPYPEVTLRAILRPVWYEGYNKAEHVWQSSSGTDAFEPKFGLMPLVFGTLKATFYSMLFAVPLALLAAVYTSEFLSKRARRFVKPTIEIMASLPSVVLGFLAALVIAPLVERAVVPILVGLVTVPMGVVFSAYLWQLLPPNVSARWRSLRLVFVSMAMAAGVWLAVATAPLVTRMLFAGDIVAWLDRQTGAGTAGWLFVTLPLATLVITVIAAGWVTPMLRNRCGHWRTTAFAAVDLGKFMVAALATFGLAYATAWTLQTLGWDPRGSFVGTYVQRNVFVVGAVMGFAVIPIIYTIADDALTVVPDSLRAGSLGAGATVWQTAVRVVIPTAMSGLFSAIMIGLGRAVGETMIVLMAAGNTPVMDWNVFNGFRTLSANIAVELPEAVVGSTHYRMLFVAALMLFLMTFIVNTIAETVRLRFRKRAFQL